MISNKHSYRYEHIESKNGLFDNYVDMSYILTMENSTRRNNYMGQLLQYNPHKHVTIQHNTGFKHCNKQLYNQNTVHDINDAYYHVFLHAKSHNYNNIIIFEDDFFFDNVEKADVHEIGMFITNNNYHIYNLGPALDISMPYTFKHHQSVFTTSAQGVIYNVKYFDFFIKIYNKGFNMMYDIVWNSVDVLKFRYYKPICFQLYEMTENIKNWGFSNVAIFFIKLLNLDKSHYPGWHVLNMLSYVITIIVLYILYYLMNRLELLFGK